MTESQLDPDYFESLLNDEYGRADEPLVLQPVDLGPILAGTILTPEPSVLKREDRQALLYPGAVNGIHGDSGIGKSWVGLFAMAEQLKGGRHVVYVDAEDGPNTAIVRLRSLGVPDDVILERFVYYRIDDEPGIASLLAMAQVMSERNVSLVVIDSVGEYLNAAGLNENHDSEVGPWLREVPRRFANTGAAVLLIDHATKSNETPLHPSGSKRKKAFFSGASYAVEACKPITKEHGGRLRLKCAKDRHGNYAVGEVVAELVAKPEPLNRGMSWKLHEPFPNTGKEASPIVLAARKAVEVLRDQPSPLSRNQLGTAIRVAGFSASNQVIRDGIDHAVMQGAITEAEGRQNAKLYAFKEELLTP